MSSIASASSSVLASQISSLQTTSQISTRVARKALDAAQEQGQAVVELLQDATELAKSTTTNRADGRLDVTA